jgi:hypothetical protein
MYAQTLAHSQGTTFIPLGLRRTSWKRVFQKLVQPHQDVWQSSNTLH